MVMNRQLKQTACPQTPQGSNLDQRPVLQGRMTTAHPDKELALPEYRADEYSWRHCNQRFGRKRRRAFIRRKGRWQYRRQVGRSDCGHGLFAWRGYCFWAALGSVKA